MSMKIKCIASCFSLLVAASAHSQNLISVGIPSASFNFVASSQKQTEWCWAASTQMILQWLGFDVDQGEVVSKVKGALINQGASDADINTALNAVAVQRTGQPAVIHSLFASGPPPASVLVNELGHQHPILLSFKSGPYSSHAVVITGARYYQTRSGPVVTSLIIRDPWPTQENIRNAGRVELAGPTLANFLPNVLKNWIVWVTPI